MCTNRQLFLKRSMCCNSPPSHTPSQNTDAVIWHKQTALCLTLSSPTSATIHQPAILYEPLAMHILAQFDGAHELPCGHLASRQRSRYQVATPTQKISGAAAADRDGHELAGACMPVVCAPGDIPMLSKLSFRFDVPACRAP